MTLSRPRVAKTQRRRRVTLGVFLDVSLDKLLPQFFDNLEFLAGQVLPVDRGAWQVRYSLFSIDVDQVPEGQEHLVQLAVERVAPQVWAALETAGLPPDIDQYSKLTIAPTEPIPHPKWTHGKGAANPSMRCPRCDAPMRYAQSHVIFWSCSRYPECKGTRSISPPGNDAPDR
jgi:hypothetical protein